MSNPVNELSKEDWEDLYVVQGRTLHNLADMFNVSLGVIYNRLGKLGIDRRPCGNKKTFDVTKEDLEEMYLVRKMGFADIAKHFGCTETSIRRLVDNFGIPRDKKPSDVFTREFLEDKISSGCAIRQISRDTGFSIPIIYTYLHKYGFEVGESSKRKMVGEEDVVVHDYLRGLTTTQLSSKYGVSLGVITRILKSNMVEIRPSNSFNKKVGNISELCSMYFDEGMSLGKIASVFDCTKGAVYSQFKKHGIKLRSKSESLEGENNGMFGKEQSDITKRNMSNAYSNDIRSVYTNCDETIDTPYQGVKRVRSSWEAAVARYFDARGIKYLYEPKRVKLPDGGSYLPDFFLLAENKYIEVKGWYRDDYLVKVDSFRAMGFSLDVWEKDKLVSLGIINSSGVAII